MSRKSETAIRAREGKRRQPVVEKPKRSSKKAVPVEADYVAEPEHVETE